MLRLPEKTPLPQTVSRLLEDKNSKRLIKIFRGRKAGRNACGTNESLAAWTSDYAALSLDRERTPLSRGLVRTWFDRPVAVWLSKTVRPGKRRPWAYRCHIVGPAFTAMRSLAREKNPENEIACAWQLAARGSWTKTEEILPVPEKIPGGPLELHLDHPQSSMKETEAFPDRKIRGKSKNSIPPLKLRYGIERFNFKGLWADSVFCVLPGFSHYNYKIDRNGKVWNHLKEMGMKKTAERQKNIE